MGVRPPHLNPPPQGCRKLVWSSAFRTDISSFEIRQTHNYCLVLLCQKTILVGISGLLSASLACREQPSSPPLQV